MSNMRQLTIEMSEELYQRFIGIGSPAQTIEDLLDEVYPVDSDNEDGAEDTSNEISKLSFKALIAEHKRLKIEPAYRVGMRRDDLEAAVRAKS